MTVAQTSWDIMLEANTNWHNSSLSSDYAQAREITENIEIKGLFGVAPNPPQRA
jgi:hypothetical protein